MHLDRRIEIQRRGHTQGKGGQVRETWRTINVVWASLRPISAREFKTDPGDRAEVTHEIVMRHGVDVRPSDRILVENRIFDVQETINVGERNRYLRAVGLEHADATL